MAAAAAALKIVNFVLSQPIINTGVEEYSLLAEDEIVDAAKKAKAAGAVRFSIVTSGRGQSKADDFDNICKNAYSN